MTTATAKAQALEQMLAGPWAPEPTDPLAPAVHLLKADGVPIVSREVKRGDVVRLEHRLIDTDMTPEQIKAARLVGLAKALNWHRREPSTTWPDLVKGIDCPFARDEAKTYLAGITIRARYVGH